MVGFQGDANDNTYAISLYEATILTCIQMLWFYLDADMCVRYNTFVIMYARYVLIFFHRKGRLIGVLLNVFLILFRY